MNQSSQPVTILSVYQPRPGKEGALVELLAEHEATLRSENYVTSTPFIQLRSPRSNAYIEIYTWRSENAATKAPASPAIAKIESRLREVAEMKPLSWIAEASEPFAHFVPVATPSKRTVEYRDTQLSARNLKRATEFYRQFAGFTISEETAEYVTFIDPNTSQVVSLSSGQTTSYGLPSYGVKNRQEAASMIEKLGGKVLKNWEHGSLRGANCQDSEGNEFTIAERKI